MDPIMALAAEHGLSVIEDCAQAHGATYKGKPVGSIGDVGCFSFCQDKIMSTGGEGGMVTTSNRELWSRMWSYKDHGKSWEAVYEREHPPGFRWLHESFGTNWRMTEMQAAIGRIQLRRMARAPGGSGFSRDSSAGHGTSAGHGHVGASPAGDSSEGAPPAAAIANEIGSYSGSVANGTDWISARRANAEKIWACARELPGLRVPEIPDWAGHAAYKCYVFVEMDPSRLKPLPLGDEEPDGQSHVGARPAGDDSVGHEGPGGSGFSRDTDVAALRDRIMAEINARGVPCFSGSCSEVYLEKAFDDCPSDGRTWRPAERLPVAKELGETSLMFLVHPTLTAAEIEKTCEVLREVMGEEVLR